MVIETLFQDTFEMDPIPMPGAQILMQYVKDAQYNKYYAAGIDTSSINAYTGANAEYFNADKRTPAYWSFAWGPGGAHPECDRR